MYINSVNFFLKVFRFWLIKNCFGQTLIPNVFECFLLLYVFITEYDALTRLGIQDPKSYLRKKFKDEPIAYLLSICVGRDILRTVEATLEEVLTSGSWFDVTVSLSFSLFFWQLKLLIEVLK